MEIGADAVLVNTAIAVARNPVSMAMAFCNAVKAGRLAYISGLAEHSEFAVASSPLSL
jgi:thiazole synthase